MTLILSETLAPPRMAMKGRDRFIEAASPRNLSSFSMRKPMTCVLAGAELLGDAEGGGVLAVGGAEGVIDVEVAEFGEFFGEGGGRFFPLPCEPRVLQQHDRRRLSWLRRLFRPPGGPDAIGGER